MTEPRQEEKCPDREASIKAVAKLAEDEMAALELQQAAIAKRKQEVKKILLGLGEMFGRHVLSENTLRLLHYRSESKRRGLTDACRQVLLETDVPLRATEICAHVNRLVPGTLDNHKSPMASVTTIMNRLCGYGEARSVLTPRGQQSWESTGNPPGGPSGPDVATAESSQSTENKPSGSDANANHTG